MLNKANTIVKSNARYICQECGSTENIQAHHQIPRDDNTLICLCSCCHSKKHPKMATKLFTNKDHQPYWENKSASSLAKEIGVHPRTVWRIAKSLGIAKGFLDIATEDIIKLYLIKGKNTGEYKTNSLIKKLKRILNYRIRVLTDSYEKYCPECGSTRLYKFGMRFLCVANARVKVQQFQCDSCGRITMNPRNNNWRE